MTTEEEYQKEKEWHRGEVRQVLQETLIYQGWGFRIAVLGLAEAMLPKRLAGLRRREEARRAAWVEAEVAKAMLDLREVA